MPQPVFIFEPLDSRHDRANFACGIDELDDYLRTKARKERDISYSGVFVAIDRTSPTAIAGYYTLSSHSIDLAGIDPNARKKLPRYPSVPTTLLGRLARSLAFRKMGLGDLLLIDALKRALTASKDVGSYAVTVDAINEEAAKFYRKFGFIPISGNDRRFYLPMATIQKLGLGDE